MRYRDALPSLARLVADILQQHPQGLSEYELLGKLRELDALPDETLTATSHLELFQVHFLLFHVLYQLRDEYWKQQKAHLEISPLKIQFLPYRKATTDLSEADPVKEYYQDLSNLEQTDSDDVIELLSRFWMRMEGGEQRRQALQTLGLDDGADFATIKKRYRELAMQHHPDRGGEAGKLQEMNAAMAWLAKYHQT